MKVIFGSLFGILITSFAAASSDGGSHGAEHGGVPVVVLYQAINVAIIFGLGFYFGKQKIVDFFLQKRNHFLQAQEKAQSILRHAEQDHAEVKTRLDKLKVTREESISKAKADANDLRSQIITDAQVLAKKLKEEALLSAKIEVERAKYQLKEQLIRDAFELSKKDLSSKATSDDQKKLQEDFISKVQVVQ
jgi:F-type H+-transporting ATPase subunit b